MKIALQLLGILYVYVYVFVGARHSGQGVGTLPLDHGGRSTRNLKNKTVFSPSFAFD
jgi:hypothetical protein